MCIGWVRGHFTSMLETCLSVLKHALHEVVEFPPAHVILDSRAGRGIPKMPVD